MNRFTLLCAMSLTLLSPSFALANTGTSTTKPDSVQIDLAGQKLMSASRIVAVDVNSHRATSFLPGMTVESVLRSLGMDAHFVPGINQLVINMPTGFTLPDSIHPISYQNPGPNQFAILVNAKTLALPPALSEGGTAYVPVYYVMKTLESLGVHSTWNGRTWTIANKVNVPFDDSMSGDVSKTFTLQLQNVNSTAANLPAPAVPPLPPISVELPLNSLLTPTTLAFNGANEDAPMNPYVQTGQAKYTVNKPLAAVEGWFNAAYTAQGFTKTGSGSSGNFKTGEYSESVVYTPTRQKDGQQESVAMSFKSLGSSQTEIEYFVCDVVIPPRPASTDLPSGASSMTVTLTSLKQGALAGGASSSAAQSSQSAASTASTAPTASAPPTPSTTTKTITDSATIEKALVAINSLTQIDAPYVGTSPQYGEIDNLSIVFNYPDGHSATVTASKRDDLYGDVVIGDVSLVDKSGLVWNDVIQAIGK